MHPASLLATSARGEATQAVMMLNVDGQRAAPWLCCASHVTRNMSLAYTSTSAPVVARDSITHGAARHPCGEAGGASSERERERGKFHGIERCGALALVCRVLSARQSRQSVFGHFYILLHRNTIGSSQVKRHNFRRGPLMDERVCDSLTGCIKALKGAAEIYHERTVTGNQFSYRDAGCPARVARS